MSARMFEVGDFVFFRSALLWLLWNEDPEKMRGLSVNDSHEIVLPAAVIQRREHVCDPCWWGYTVRAADASLGSFDTCGRNLAPRKALWR